jgi:hypothetical protein
VIHLVASVPMRLGPAEANKRRLEAEANKRRLEAEANRVQWRCGSWPLYAFRPDERNRVLS